MSKETSQWLNQNTLIGFADKRGTAWHYRASAQGDEPNHYPGPVPVEDVRRRLFGWNAESREVWVRKPGAPGPDLAEMMAQPNQDALTAYVLSACGMREEPERQAITRSDNDHVMGIFSDGYTPHPYDEWLVCKVATILDDELHIGSAGLLRGGAIAWVQVEMPESIRTPEGVEFRPHLLATTSFDGSLATTYKRAVTNVVCDNTHALALGERGQALKVRHSRYASLKVDQARQALAVIQETADAFAAEVRALCQTTVTDKQWAAFLDAHTPLPGEEGRSRTIADKKRDTLTRLYRTDIRVAPWAGTAWGVLQCVNTYAHHEGTVRGASRAERNMINAVTTRGDRLDADTLDTLHAVLAADDRELVAA